MVNRGEEKVWVQMNVVPRSTGNTNSGNKPHKDEHISYKRLQGRVVVPRMVATSEKNVQLAFLNDQAKQLKSMI